MNTDLIWKIASIGSSLIILPLFGWVWSTNEDVRRIELKNEYADEKVERMEKELKQISENETKLKLMQKDIEFIKKEVKSISSMMKAGDK
tara:strand:+ start:343 stop:612 length:270 start_codon:yes stop_codon:yes gene_type:complete